jgi:hypothetical protein
MLIADTQPPPIDSPQAIGVTGEEGSDQPPGDAYVYAVRDEEAYLQIDEDEKPEIIAELPPDPAWFKCSFCRRPARALRRRVSDAGSQHPGRHRADLHL